MINDRGRERKLSPDWITNRNQFHVLKSIALRRRVTRRMTSQDHRRDFLIISRCDVPTEIDLSNTWIIMTLDESEKINHREHLLAFRLECLSRQMCLSSASCLGLTNSSLRYLSFLSRRRRQFLLSTSTLTRRASCLCARSAFRSRHCRWDAKRKSAQARDSLMAVVHFYWWLYLGNLDERRKNIYIYIKETRGKDEFFSFLCGQTSFLFSDD